MEISEKLNLNYYFHDQRFQMKKPKKGDWKARCGDKFYSLNLVFSHTCCKPPEEFRSMIGEQGIRTNHPKEQVDRFKNWVISNFSEGINDFPIDNHEIDKYPGKDHPKASEQGY